MTDLPPGWEWATLDEIAVWSSGGTPKASNPSYYGGSIPWAVIGDLNDGVATKTASCITQDGLYNSSAKIAPAGAVLMAMYGSIGKLGIAGIPMATNQAIAFARDISVDANYLFWYLMSQRQNFQRSGKGAAQKNISQAIIREWPIPIAPLAEQRRIVAALEDHLSRIDAGRQLLDANDQRLARLSKRIIVDAVPIPGPSNWRIATVADAGTVDLGRQRHPDWHTGQYMKPYLRVANVFEDEIDTSDLMEMNFPPEVFERFLLREGDILLNEGQSPEFLGRPAMYRGVPGNVAFTNSLLRFRSSSDVDPEWALLVFRRHMHAGRFIKEVRITTNIAHLSAGRFKAIEFPIAPLPEQRRIVSAVRDQLTEIAKMRDDLHHACVQATALRQSLLRQAFSGRLIPQDPDAEPASVLLERIHAERAARPKTKRTRQTTKQKDALL